MAKVAGSSGFPMGFFLLFFLILNMGFCFGGILVSSGQWWLGFLFRWVFLG